MKITIDTNKKTIEIAESVTIGEFMEQLKKLIPNEKERNEYLILGAFQIKYPEPFYREPINHNDLDITKPPFTVLCINQNN